MMSDISEQAEEKVQSRVRQRGATLVEYALMVAMIAIVCITAVEFLGNGTSERFQSVNVPFEETSP
jgi:Flp pilus assembly pilin Flp